MNLIVVKTKYIPNGFKYIVVLVWLLCHRDPNKIDYQHENIHLQQELEMLFIFFYLWYGIEWLVRLIGNGFNAHEAYHSISFEQEAYENEDFENYIRLRKHYAWTKYL